MALKKSELYSSIWQSCDALRGGMDASQYKDYVLTLLFIKYISDKYAGQPFAPITVPPGASFADMVALKGRKDIGDKINTQILGPLEKANRLSGFADFNEDAKLGSGQEKVDRLTDLISIFENPALDFSRNRADGDDILGDAYEYLMRHFATESGKSKGQFYTPAEVSRVIAQLLGVRERNPTRLTTAYDPTCGSGSLLLKVADEALPARLSLYGQEKDVTTAGLARMNVILHDMADAEVVAGNTLADPKFLDGPALRQFDYVVANPPFSDKRWSTGVKVEADPFGRYGAQAFGTPPAKQGDYAYLLHILRSLKSTGRGACILPHGVLFRGNAEAEIRRKLVRHGYIEGIIGLPANLFFGTGIPACIVVLDKAGAATRFANDATDGGGIFMIDASSGFMKDGPKNRLRARDVHRIVDVYRSRKDVPRYARLVGLAEIEKNDFNLNLPRYIDAAEPEDVQDIDGHLNGGIPAADIEALDRWWAVCPGLKAALFRDRRSGYLDLAVEKAQLKTAIHAHPEFAAFEAGIHAHFAQWRSQTAAVLKTLEPGFHPKPLIAQLSESLLGWFWSQPLIDPYAVYQHLMDFWAQTMQDDADAISADGWRAQVQRLTETRKGKDGKPGKTIDRGWVCDLVPKALVVARYLAAEQAQIDALAAELQTVAAQRSELEEEHGGDEGVFAEFDKLNRAAVAARAKEQASQPAADAASAAELKAEADVLALWLQLTDREALLKKQLKDAEAALDAQALAKYPQLTEAEVKALVVDDKWLAALERDVRSELERVGRELTQRVKLLAERYETPLPQAAAQVEELEAKVKGHLARMGFAWT